VHGWREPERLAVVPAGAAYQTMAGRCEADGEDTWFVPRFPFLPGTYTVLLDGEAAAEIVRAAPEGATTRVDAIYPSAGVVPVNLLKVYVDFSAPMAEGQAMAGDAFLELELWDRERRRRTLLLDPGRIKRGLAGHEAAGYPLREGEQFTVRVDAALRDATGRPLAAGAERTYRVGAPVRRRVDVADWSVEPGVVHFDRPLDRALLERAFDLPGEIGPGERSWIHRRPPGEHVLRVDAGLEDLAGNSLRRVFDRDLTRRADDPLDVDHVDLRFTCG
jgi:hypothetical protein